MSDFSHEQAPGHNENAEVLSIEKQLLVVETQIGRLLGESDGVDFRIGRRFTPNGLLRFEGGLFVAEMPSIGGPDYLSVTDIRKTTPYIGGVFYKIREERIPIDEGDNNPLMMSYSFKVKEINTLDSHPYRVANAKKASFEVKELPRPQLLKRFPFPETIQTHIGDTELVNKAGNGCSESDTSSDQLELLKITNNLSTTELERLQELVGSLIDEFVDFNY